MIVMIADYWGLSRFYPVCLLTTVLLSRWRTCMLKIRRVRC